MDPTNNIYRDSPLFQQVPGLPEELQDRLQGLTRKLDYINSSFHQKHLYIWYLGKLDIDDLTKFMQNAVKNTIGDFVVSHFMINENDVTGVYIFYKTLLRSKRKDIFNYTYENMEYIPDIHRITTKNTKIPLLSFLWNDLEYTDKKYNLCLHFKSKLKCCKNYVEYRDRQTTPKTVKSSIPAKPKPVEPKPVEPKPVEPKPAKPKPVEPTSAKYRPSKFIPAEQDTINLSEIYNNYPVSPVNHVNSPVYTNTINSPVNCVNSPVYTNTINSPGKIINNPNIPQGYIFVGMVTVENGYGIASVPSYYNERTNHTLYL